MTGTTLGSQPIPSIDLYWIPLGAGQHVVRFSGKLFEIASALRQRRRPCDLYHSALVVAGVAGRFVIEMTPVEANGSQRGVVAQGPVGTKWAGRFRLFRYEVRCWKDGNIPDAIAAVSTTRVAIDEAPVARIVELARSIPTPTWGRDELRTGEMWNSNSVTSWLLASAGIDLADIAPPHNGRAPGWIAGLLVADRQS